MCLPVGGPMIFQVSTPRLQLRQRPHLRRHRSPPVRGAAFVFAEVLQRADAVGLFRHRFPSRSIRVRLSSFSDPGGIL